MLEMVLAPASTKGQWVDFKGAFNALTTDWPIFSIIMCFTATVFLSGIITGTTLGCLSYGLTSSASKKRCKTTKK